MADMETTLGWKNAQSGDLHNIHRKRSYPVILRLKNEEMNAITPTANVVHPIQLASIGIVVIVIVASCVVNGNQRRKRQPALAPRVINTQRETATDREERHSCLGKSSVAPAILFRRQENLCQVIASSVSSISKNREHAINRQARSHGCVIFQTEST